MLGEIHNPAFDRGRIKDFCSFFLIASHAIRSVPGASMICRAARFAITLPEQGPGPAVFQISCMSNVSVSAAVLAVLWARAFIWTAIPCHSRVCFYCSKTTFAHRTPAAAVAAAGQPTWKAFCRTHLPRLGTRGPPCTGQGAWPTL